MAQRSDCMDWTNLPKKGLLQGYDQTLVWQADKQHLQPYRGSQRCLAFYRGWAQIASTIYFVLILSLQGFSEYFLFLTNWGNCMMAICFNLLSVGHLLNGHFSCSQNPRVWKVWGQYWQIAVFVYELTAILIFEITFCFWTIVLPFMIWGPKWEAPRPPNTATEWYGDPFVPSPEQQAIDDINKRNQLIVLGVAHSVPFFVFLIDLNLGSIQFYMRHLAITFPCGVAYLGWHLIQTFSLRGPTKLPIYPSHDWYNFTLRSSLLTVACLVIFLLLYLMLVKVSQYKINRKFVDGQVVTLVQEQVEIAAADAFHKEL